MVGRIYEEEYYTLLHTKMKALGLSVVSEKKTFYVCPIVSLNDPQGHESHDLCRAPHNNAAYQM